MKAKTKQTAAMFVACILIAILVLVAQCDGQEITQDAVEGQIITGRLFWMLVRFAFAIAALVTFMLGVAAVVIYTALKVKKKFNL